MKTPCQVEIFIHKFRPRLGESIRAHSFKIFFIFYVRFSLSVLFFGSVTLITCCFFCVFEPLVIIFIEFSFKIMNVIIFAISIRLLAMPRCSPFRVTHMICIHDLSNVWVCPCICIIIIQHVFLFLCFATWHHPQSEHKQLMMICMSVGFVVRGRARERVRVYYSLNTQHNLSKWFTKWEKFDRSTSIHWIDFSLHSLISNAKAVGIFRFTPANHRHLWKMILLSNIFHVSLKWYNRFKLIEYDIKVVTFEHRFLETSEMAYAFAWVQFHLNGTNEIIAKGHIWAIRALKRLRRLWRWRRWRRWRQPHNMFVWNWPQTWCIKYIDYLFVDNEPTSTECRRLQ